MTLTEHIQPLLDKRLPAAFVATVLLGCGSALGADHLVPLPSDLSAAAYRDDYASIITQVFKPAFSSDVRARVYVTAAGPGPTAADMIFLRDTNGHFSIVNLGTDKPLWMYRKSMQAANNRFRFHLDPPDFHNVRSKRCEMPISAALGRQIADVWQKVLMETSYSKNRDRAMDGADLVFSMEVKYGDFDAKQELAGATWSPDTPKLGLLVTVVNAMQYYCETKNQTSLKEMESAASALQRKFQ